MLEFLPAETLKGRRDDVISNHPRDTNMANSGAPWVRPDQGGWISGTCGFTSPHNIYTDSERHERLDGKPFDMTSLERQQAKTMCLICGAWVISTD